MDTIMGDTSEERLMKDFLKFTIDNLFWKRKWFRKWLILIPTWMIVAIPLFGYDRYLIGFYMNLYCFLLALSIYDNEIKEDGINVKGYQGAKIERKLKAKKAAY